uniref:Uncharacterized protein n=1 Tax=Cacopsylla melanoneura TaxID=428564 RepID=A0A8D8YSG1_9HEMI
MSARFSFPLLLSFLQGMVKIVSVTLSSTSSVSLLGVLISPASSRGCLLFKQPSSFCSSSICELFFALASVSCSFRVVILAILSSRSMIFSWCFFWQRLAIFLITS